MALMSKAREITIAAGILITILGIGMLMTGPVVVWLNDRIRPLQTKAAISGLEIATKSYKIEYNRLPIIPPSEATVIESRGILISTLLGENETNNPRKVKFYDPAPYRKGRGGAARNAANEWELKDAWGNFYRILLDADDNGKIPDPKPGAVPDKIATPILIYSAGPDGDFSTWTDNIRSWK